MNVFAAIWTAACCAGLAFSLASARVLGARSRATQAGWIASAAYFVVAGIDAARATHAPFHLDDILLAILIAAFVVAGRRDEPQAEPWYWPTRSGQSGAEPRAVRADGRTVSTRGKNARMPDVEISIRPNGPYLVKGTIALTDAEGNAIDLGGKTTVALCRCGASAMKPFCDGTHSKIGFMAANAAVADAN